MYKPFAYLVVIYFPTYLPIYKTYFLHDLKLDINWVWGPSTT
jgi:hypothetical protein